MTVPVESYVAGRWQGPAGTRVELLNAATGTPVAVFGTDPIDMVPVLDHARSVGGPALREMPFHDRALVLKALAAHLNGHREQFAAISTWTGATPRDSAVDIDGGIGVLFTYASKGRRELPNSTVLVDGPSERLGRTGQFVGQHIYTSRHGVALQINAFNFPVWGMLEKLAPAFLAGVPTVVKPASQASYLAVAVVQEIIESGLLPEGSLQLVAGGSRGLLDLLTEQDTVAFTGSAATAAVLRSHRSVLENGVRFSSEADSLNFSVLGLDVSPSSAEFDLYVRQLVTEMTSKAGQKCTAIRRALVPDALVPAVIEAVRSRIADKVRVGDPTAAGVTMGALVSTAQRDDVREVPGRPCQCRGGGDRRSRPFRRSSTPTLSAVLSCRRCCYGPRIPVVASHTTSKSSGPSARCWGTATPHMRSSSPRGGGGVWSAPWSPPTHWSSGISCWASRRGTAGCWCWTTTVPQSPPATVPRCRTWCMAAPVGPVMAKNSAASEASCTTCNAPPSRVRRRRCRPSPERGSPGHLATPKANTRSARAWRSCGSVTPWWPGRGPSPSRTSMPSPTFPATGSMPTWTSRRPPRIRFSLAGLRTATSWCPLQPACSSRRNTGPVLANYGLENLRFTTPVYPGDALTVTLTAKSISPRSDADYGEVVWDATVVNQKNETVAGYDVLTLVAKHWPR